MGCGDTYVGKEAIKPGSVAIVLYRYSRHGECRTGGTHEAHLKTLGIADSSEKREERKRQGLRFSSST